MARYPLNMPASLKLDAEHMASEQGVSLNQFILWAVAEKVGNLKHQLDDPAFPHVTYRRGASGSLIPVVRGTGLRVQTIVIAHELWGMSPAQVATDHALREEQVMDALAFYASHRQEIDNAIVEERRLEPQ